MRRRGTAACGAGLLLAALVAQPLLSVAPASAGSGVTFTVDTTAGRTPISPLIYGINSSAADAGFTADLAATRPTTVRLGGNRWTAYNWLTNNSNAGNDYCFQNDDYLSSSTSPGAAVLPTVTQDQQAGVTTMVTVPIVDHLAGDRNGGTCDLNDERNSSANVMNSPDYVNTRMVTNNAVDPAGVGGAPNPASKQVYQDHFLAWLRQSAPSARLMVGLDNEPDDWRCTHPEAWPPPGFPSSGGCTNPFNSSQAVQTGALQGYAAFTDRELTYARAVKAVAPDAVVAGPSLATYAGILQLQGGPDSSSSFLDYYLGRVHAANAADGKALVDDFDVHWYSQVAGVGSTDTSASVVDAREQAPRSLWDPGYVENSWITSGPTNGAAIRLLPWLQEHIASGNPGMRIAMSEWDYGAGGHISGAIADADVLGILGRYGVHTASHWPLSPDQSFVKGAFKVFRNYDGRGASFGDTEVSATTSDPATTSVYASTQAADASRLVLVAINKAATPTTATIRLTGFSAGQAAVYTLTGASPDPQPAAGLTPDGSGTLTYAMPAQSVSVIVPSAAAPSSGTTYHAVTPYRVLDSRTGLGFPGALAPHTSAVLQVTGGSSPVPAGATSVALNVTATAPRAGGYLSVGPAESRDTSNLNFAAGQSIPNLVISALTPAGTVTVYNGSAGTVHVVADIQGFHTADASGTTYHAVTPYRVLDSRTGLGFSGALAGHGSMVLQVTGGSSPVPPGASSVALNTTATAGRGPGYLSVAPQESRETSNVNFVAGQSIPNLVISALSPTGTVTIYNGANAPVHVVADIQGYSTPDATGAAYLAVTPYRVLDSRTGLGFSGALPGHGSAVVQVTGGASPVPADATSVALNTTATAGGGAGYLSVAPAESRETSNVNFVAGQSIPNLVISRLSPTGTVTIYNGSNAPVHVVADVQGYGR